MINRLPPVRSIDDAQAPAALRSALAASRAEAPSAEALARMAARLGVPAPVANHAGARPSTSTSTTGADSMLSAWGRRALLPCVALLCALGGWSLHAVLAPAPEVPQEKDASPTPSAAPIAAAPPTMSPTAPRLLEPVEALAPALPQPLLPARAPDARSRKQRPDAPSAAPDPNDELALLARAQAQLIPAPRRALALAEEHARRYPQGVFREERELIAIVGLLSSGDLRSARARADRFEHAFPASVHTARLQSLIAVHKNASLDAPITEPAASRPTGEN